MVTESDPLTKQEQFAVEIQLCKEAMASEMPDKCELYGKVEIVDTFGDVKVEVVDIKVQKVDNFANSPGQWKLVDNFADYKVEIVDNFVDYKVEFVDNFPGCEAATGYPNCH